MRVRITVCIALLLIAPLVRANLEAQVDTDTVSIGETVQLTLRADGTDITGSPDLQPLERDFDVQSTEHSTDFSSTNGDPTRSCGALPSTCRELSYSTLTATWISKSSTPNASK